MPNFQWLCCSFGLFGHPQLWLAIGLVDRFSSLHVSMLCSMMNCRLYTYHCFPRLISSRQNIRAARLQAMKTMKLRDHLSTWFVLKISDLQVPYLLEVLLEYHQYGAELNTMTQEQRPHGPCQTSLLAHWKPAKYWTSLHLHAEQRNPSATVDLDYRCTPLLFCVLSSDVITTSSWTMLTSMHGERQRPRQYRHWQSRKEWIWV